MNTMIADIPITNDPLTGLKRKAQWFELKDLGEDLSISFRVKLYDENDEIVDNIRTPMYVVILRADNTTPVDSTTGAFVLDAILDNGVWSSPTIQHIIGEYDFIKAALQAGSSLLNLIIAGVARADLGGRFNI